MKGGWRGTFGVAVHVFKDTETRCRRAKRGLKKRVTVVSGEAQETLFFCLLSLFFCESPLLSTPFNVPN